MAVSRPLRCSFWLVSRRSEAADPAALDPKDRADPHVSRRSVTALTPSESSHWTPPRPRLRCLTVIDVINPATDELITQLPEPESGQVAAAFARAQAAQKSWQATPYPERAICIARFAALLDEETSALALTTTREMGKPIAQAEGEVKALQGRISFFLERTEAELRDEQLLSADQGGTAERIRHEPLGVIGNISAWNYPYFVGGNVFLPALLTGNAVLYKPSELASMTGEYLGRLLHESGIPKDVFQVLVGGPSVGQALLDQPLGAMFFTGSNATGARIASALAPRMIKFALELGGKDPVYLADDIDLGHAAENMAEGAFYNTGQSCCAVERIYVHASRYEGFLEAFVAATQKLKLGDPEERDTFIGPLARRSAAISDLQKQVDEAKQRGARILLGGERAPRAGHYYQPTIVADAPQDSLIMQAESFGPIIGVRAVKDDAEAVQLMNDTTYGLTASVYSKDEARALKILEEVDAGTGYFNCCDRVSPRLPWTGRRGSGIGCTLSTYGIEAFLRPKALHLRPPAW
ncbi:MAG: aldehyde dehydrogenase family protein [Polyangiaceae bacterium]|nr:aldehyde dehydrogenase family protein [Polyangiaceae bacterium]